MATAQQLRAAAHDAPPTSSRGLPSYYNPSAVNASKILNQVTYTLMFLYPKHVYTQKNLLINYTTVLYKIYILYYFFSILTFFCNIK